MMVLRLVLRLIRGGGRSGYLRLFLMTIGIAATVASVGTALAYPLVVDARAHRAAQRIAVRAQDDGPKPILYLEVDDFVRDRRWMRVMVSADPGAPLPPGLTAYPKVGETVASPALAEAARHSPKLARRLGTVVAEIGPEGLQGPDEYVSYSGLTNDLRSHAPAAIRYGANVRDVPDLPPAGVLTGEILLLVTGPALLFLLVSSRLSAATRARRLAALRLVGVSRRQLLAVARAEASVAAGLGALLGVLVFQLTAPRLGEWGGLGIGWYATDAHLSPLATVGAVSLVVVAAALVAGQGLGRVLADATGVRRDSERLSAHPVRFVPFLAGLSLLIVFAILTRDHEKRLYDPNAVYVVIAGMLLGVGGLLWALPALVRSLAGLVSGRARGLAVRLGARRVQFETSSVVRTVTGLVLLVVAASLGQAVLRAVALAAGAQSQRQSIQVGLTDVPLAQRAKLLAVPSVASILTVGGLLTDSGQPSTGAVPQDAGNGTPVGSPDPSRAVTVVYVDCRHLRALTAQSLDGCRDGQAYRLQDADPAVPRNRFAPGGSVRLDSPSGASRVITVPSAELTVSGLLGMGYISLDEVVVTSASGPPGGIPDQGYIDLVVGAGSDAMESLQSDIAAAAPAAQPRPGRDVFGIEMYRVHRGAVALALAIAIVLSCLTFVVTTVDRAFERRGAVASLVVLGTPGSLLRRAQLVQIGMTLGPGLGLAVLISHLASYGYLVVADPRLGPSWGPTAWSALMAVVVTVAALVSAMIVPGRNPRAEDLRRL